MNAWTTVFVCLENITEDFGTNMKSEDKQSFEDWFDKLPKDIFLAHKEKMEYAWQEAIRYEQSKPVRTYRWDGVLR